MKKEVQYIVFLSFILHVSSLLYAAECAQVFPDGHDEFVLSEGCLKSEITDEFEHNHGSITIENPLEPSKTTIDFCAKESTYCSYRLKGINDNLYELFNCNGEKIISIYTKDMKVLVNDRVINTDTRIYQNDTLIAYTNADNKNDTDTIVYDASGKNDTAVITSQLGTTPYECKSIEFVVHKNSNSQIESSVQKSIIAAISVLKKLDKYRTSAANDERWRQYLANKPKDSSGLFTGILLGSLAGSIAFIAGITTSIYFGCKYKIKAGKGG